MKINNIEFTINEKSCDRHGLNPAKLIENIELLINHYDLEPDQMVTLAKLAKCVLRPNNELFYVAI